MEQKLKDDKWRKKSRVVRKASFEKVPKGFFSVIRTVIVEFCLPDGRSVTLKCIGNHTVEQIKHQALDKMYDTYPNLEEGHDFFLTYEMDGCIHEICDLQQTFQTLRVVSIWLKTSVKGSLALSPVRPRAKEEFEFNKNLGYLMGVAWGSYQSISNDELYMTRRKLTNIRRQAVVTRDPLAYAMEPSLEACHTPPSLIAKLRDGRFIVSIYAPNKSSTKIPVHMDDYPSAVLKVYFNRLTPALRTAFDIPGTAKYTDYVMKVCGCDDYIWGSYRIIDFLYIRECLSRDKEPTLALCLPLDENDDEVLPEHDPWFLVDESTGVTEEHQQLTILNKNHNEIVAFSFWDMTRNFQIKVLGFDYLDIDDGMEDPDEAYVEACLYHGQFQLAPPVRTEAIPFAQSLRWYCCKKFDIQIRNIPKESRVNINVIGVYRSKTVKVKTGLRMAKDGEQHVILRWANMQLLNHRSVLVTGRQVLMMWPMPDNDDVSFETFTATSAPNESRGSKSRITKLHIDLDTYMHPVVFPSATVDSTTHGAEEAEELTEPIHGSQEWKSLEEILKQDRLDDIDAESKRLLFKYRNYCKNRPNALPKILMSVDPANQESMCKMRHLLSSWPQVSIEVAVELLDSQFVDEHIRAFGTNALKELTNKKLLVYLLQLTQALKFEPYHDSPLARFLLTRSLKSKRIGHNFFWFLKSEMENPHVSQRCFVLLEAYLRGCGKDMIEKLQNQTEAVNCLKSVSYNVLSKMKTGLSSNKMAELLREELKNTQFPKCFQAPYDPKITLGNLKIDKSKIMDSKKKPLWLEFENYDKTVVSEQDTSIKIMFKQGDDLRQDMLTLQMLCLMNQLWQEEGLDLYLLPYGCISTGLLNGLIQVVGNARTVASIQKEFGGLIRGSFKDEVLKKWLEDKNPIASDLEEAIKKFMLSCAGYCVATYVLGIGDRHNDNIMVTTSGNLFHIDFGHFLGNTKRFYGIQRERVPFVLTPDFVYVMGTEQGAMFQKFKDSCVHAFLIIRRHAALFINLFHMMKATGIPELTSVRDIRYLKKVLILSKSEQEARNHFLDEISGVLKKSWTVQVNWLMHAIMHAGN